MKWIKRKIRNLLMSLTVFDKKMLSQTTSGSNIGIVYDKNAESLLHGLKNGVINKEVETLRWRMYKVLDESKNIKTKVISYDEDGYPITESVAFNPTVGLSKIKVDDFDDYKLELVVNNDEITLSTFLEGIEEVKPEDILTSIDLDGNQTATIGTIKTEQVDEVESANKIERVISCVRDFRPKFQIENFTKKMNVRTISETEKLLEFYVSKYSNDGDRKTSLFLSEINKAIKNPRATDFLDILSVRFISYNTVGVKDMLDFEYKITKFDKLVEFDGYFVIKFKSEVIKNGESLIEQYREEELDKKYENREKKNK